MDRAGLHDAMAYLASRCDFAMTLDGAGFSGPDASAGHAMAYSDVGEWDEAVEALAGGFAIKYRGQLEAGGFDVDAIAEGATFEITMVERDRARPKIREWRRQKFLRERGPDKSVLLAPDGSYEVEFRYDETLVDAIKAAVPGGLRKFEQDGGRKFWRCQPGAASAVVAFADEFNFEVEDGTREQLLTDIAEHGALPEPKPEYRIERAGDTLRFYFKYGGPGFGYIKSAVSKMGARFAREPEPHWHLTVTAHNGPAIESFVATYAGPDGPYDIRNIEVGDLRGLRAEADAAIELSRAEDAEIEIPAEVGGGRFELYPYQRACVAYVEQHRRVIIGDGVGLGKTPEALVSLAVTGTDDRALIVCPATLKLNWLHETVNKWLPHRNAITLEGRTPSEIPLGTDIVIVNYDVVDAWEDVLLAWNPKALILDESHYVKTPKARRSKACAKLAKGCDVRILLTATASKSRPAELINQLKILGTFGKVASSWKEFVTRFCAAHHNGYGWDISGASNLAELNERLRAACYIRRKKSEVAGDLPPKAWHIIPMEIDNRREYDFAAAELVEWTRRSAAKVAAARRLAKDDAAREVARKVAAAIKAEQLVKLTALRRLAARGKVKQGIEWAADLVEQGEKVIMFAHHRDVQDELAAAFPGAARIAGGDTAAKKNEAVNRFQGCGRCGVNKQDHDGLDHDWQPNDCMVLVASLGAAREGLTLTASSNVVFFEVGWTPGDQEQNEGRIHRIGQDADICNYWYLASAGTIDEYMINLLDEKRKVLAGVLDGDEESMRQAVAEALLSRLNAALEPEEA